MSESNDIPRYDLLGFAYNQYERLGLDWRFPLNPTFNDLCDRAECCDMVPLVLLVPKSMARNIIDGESDSMVVRFQDLSERN